MFNYSNSAFQNFVKYITYIYLSTHPLYLHIINNSVNDIKNSVKWNSGAVIMTNMITS